ncbi:MAG: M48 family metalloprotease [Clostridiales bacterium]|jgi:heat shock protein HtpX|nr:M48 family metalloprotease [Clostridiales bacterium]
MFESIRHNKRKTYFIVALVFALLSLIVYFFADYTGYAEIALPIAVIVSFLTAFSSYYFSDRIILGVTKAHPADEAADQKIRNIMEGLVIAAGVPMPKVYVIEDDSLNAFATGRDPNHAVVCVTRGLVSKLDYYQLEGVLAHELAHIKNYDILLATIATVMIGVVVMLSHMFQRMMFYGRKRNNDRGGGSMQLILLIVSVVFIILAPIFGQLLKMALSRNREYLADAAAIEFTRNPEGLATALEAISYDSAVECADPATASMFIANPVPKKGDNGEIAGEMAVKGAAGGKRTKGGWFDTHPPIQARIEAIRGITA